MRDQVLEREQLLEIGVEEAFELFADAADLERITPPWLHFRITSPMPIEMRQGALIEYRLRLAAVRDPALEREQLLESRRRGASSASPTPPASSGSRHG